MEVFFAKFNNLGRRISREGSTKVKRQINSFINKQKRIAKEYGYNKGYEQGIIEGKKIEKKSNIEKLKKLKKQNDGTYLTTGYNVAIYEAQKRIRSNE